MRSGPAAGSVPPHRHATLHAGLDRAVAERREGDLPVPVEAPVGQPDGLAVEADHDPLLDVAVGLPLDDHLEAVDPAAVDAQDRPYRLGHVDA